MKLTDRVDSLEKAIEDHLIESGAIRSDLAWLKKALYFVMGSPVIIEALRYLHAAR